MIIIIVINHNIDNHRYQIKRLKSLTHSISIVRKVFTGAYLHMFIKQTTPVLILCGNPFGFLLYGLSSYNKE